MDLSPNTGRLVCDETGRQPWTVYGVIRTAESMSPVAAQQVATTLIGFIILYIFVFGAGSFYILRLIAQGPKPYEDPSEDNFYDHSVTESQGRALSGDKNAGENTKEMTQKILASLLMMSMMEGYANV